MIRGEIRQAPEIIKNVDNDILVSSASAWEISTKYRIFKLPEAKDLIENYAETLEKALFSEISMTNAHAIRAGLVPIAHRGVKPTYG